MNDSYAAAIRSLWTGRCTVSVNQPITSESSGRAKKGPTDLITDEPCRISFNTIEPTVLSDQAHKKTQIITLFCRQDLQIPPGSKITVTQNGVTGVYQKSGVPAVYTVHQEIPLELWKGWA